MKLATIGHLRAAVAVGALALCIAVAGGVAQAADINKIHFLIPGGAGGGWDGTARGTAISNECHPRFGQIQTFVQRHCDAIEVGVDRVPALPVTASHQRVGSAACP